MTGPNRHINNNNVFLEKLKRNLGFKARQLSGQSTNPKDLEIYTA